MLLAALLMLQAVTAEPLLQTQAKQSIAPPEAMAAPEQQSDDVVVAGLRDIDNPGSAVTRRTLGSGRTGVGARTSLTEFQLSQRFAKCALSGSVQIMSLLRDTIDGNINSSRQRSAQGRLVQIRSTCAQDPAIGRETGLATISGDYDMSYYDRGALLIEAMHRYRPDIALIARQTADPEVQRRFDLREVPRARFRLPVDRQYFEIVVCLVRLQPELSTRLALTEGSPDTVARLEAAIVNRGRLCVGNAKSVYFDPSQFRFYIADAVYRWVVAAEGVGSLIPSN